MKVRSEGATSSNLQDRIKSMVKTSGVFEGFEAAEILSGVCLPYFLQIDTKNTPVGKKGGETYRGTGLNLNRVLLKHLGHYNRRKMNRTLRRPLIFTSFFSSSERNPSKDAEVCLLAQDGPVEE